MVVCISSLSGQETATDWDDFVTQHEMYYANVNRTDILNFSCLISSNSYIDFIKLKADSTYYYPLKIVWTREGKVFYIMLPFPEGSNDELQKAIPEKVKNLKKLFTGTLLDWQQLCLYSPFKDIPKNARIKFRGDTIGVSYKIYHEDKIVKLKKTFTKVGLLLRVIWESGNMKIITYPSYDNVLDKWLCFGWDSQIYNNGEIVSGMTVGLELVNLSGFWLPTRFDILVQTTSDSNQKSLSSLYFKNHILNENFELIEPPR
jgi:hypothetical protein